MMKNHNVSVRKQKTKKNYVKLRLILCAALLFLLFLAVIFAGKLCPWDPNAQDYGSALLPPSLSHPAGTDRFGRDMLSRIIAGLQTSVLATVSLVAIITVSGTIIGILCGYFGGLADGVIMRITDVCLAFPGLVFALAIAALLDGGLANAVLALAVISWPKYARIARSQTLAVKNETYISAAILAGGNCRQIILRHIIPNCCGPVLVTSMLDMGTMLMELAGLSFLGLGAKPPTAELGNMMSEGRSMLQTYPWVILGPGIAIFVVVVIFNLFGDALRDYLDPRGGSH